VKEGDTFKVVLPSHEKIEHLRFLLTFWSRYPEVFLLFDSHGISVVLSCEVALHFLVFNIVKCICKICKARINLSLSYLCISFNTHNYSGFTAWSLIRLNVKGMFL